LCFDTHPQSRRRLAYGRLGAAGSHFLKESPIADYGSFGCVELYTNKADHSWRSVTCGFTYIGTFRKRNGRWWPNDWRFCYYNPTTKVFIALSDRWADMTINQHRFTIKQVMVLRDDEYTIKAASEPYGCWPLNNGVGWWAKLTATKLKRVNEYKPCEEDSCVLGQLAKRFTNQNPNREAAEAAFLEAYKGFLEAYKGLVEPWIQCNQCQEKATGRPTGWVETPWGWGLFQKLSNPDYVNARMNGEDTESDFSILLKPTTATMKTKATATSFVEKLKGESLTEEPTPAANRKFGLS